MKTFLLTLQIVVSIFLITSILLQNSKGGLGSAFGGGEFRTKRGAEKIVFRGTIFFSLVFLILAIINILL